MAKGPTLSDITNILNSTTILNNNWDLIEAAFENTISRDGSSPNYMEADLDLNSNDLLNVGVVDAATFSVSGSDITTTLTTAVADAAASAAEAVAAKDAAVAAEASVTRLVPSGGSFTADGSYSSYEIDGVYDTNWLIVVKFFGVEQDHTTFTVTPDSVHNTTTISFSANIPNGYEVETVASYQIATPIADLSVVYPEADGRSLEDLLLASGPYFTSRAQFEAASIGTNVDYWTVRENGVELHYERSTSYKAIVSGNGIYGKPVGVNTVMHWGASGDYSSKTTLGDKFSTLVEAQAQYSFATSLTQSLDWAAVQAAHYYEKLKLIQYSPLTSAGQESAYAYLLTFNPGSYWINDSVDMTGMNTGFSTWTILAEGAVVYGPAISGGYPTFDLLTSRRCKVVGGEWISPLSDPNRCMFQIGRDTTGTVADNHIFEGCQIKGRYTLGAVYNYASEEVSFPGCLIRNDVPTGAGSYEGYLSKAYCVVQDGDHYFGAKSKYVTVAAANTAASFLQNYFPHCDIRKTGGGATVFCSRTNNHAFPHSYLTNDAGYIFHLFSNTSTNVAAYLDLTRCHFETDDADLVVNALAGIFYVDATSGSTNVIADMPIYEDQYPRFEVSLFAKSANVGNVVLNKPRIVIEDFPRDTGQLLFESGTEGDYYIYDGDVTLNVAASTSVTIAGMGTFTGRLKVRDKTRSEWHLDGNVYALSDDSGNVFMNTAEIMEDSSGAAYLTFVDTSGAAVGKIKASSSNLTVLPDGSTQVAVIATTAIYPNTDNSYSLGIGSRHYKNGYINKVYMNTVYDSGSNQVLTDRQTGWTAATGTATRTTFDTATVTLSQLAERVKALEDDLLTHGIIGA